MTRHSSKKVKAITGKSARQLTVGAVAAAVGLLAKQQLAQAANGTDIWSAVAPGTWGISGNWSVSSANIPPINGDDLTFNVGAGTFINSSTAASANLLSSVNSITLTAATGATTFSAYNNALALTITGSGIANSSTNSVIFSELLAIGNNDSNAVFNAGTKNLTLSNAGGFVVGTSSSLTFSGASTASVISVAGATTLGGGSTFINSGDATSLIGALSLSGNNTVSVGSGALTLGTSLIDAGTGSTISVSGGLMYMGVGSTLSLGNSDNISVSGGTLSLPLNANGSIATGTNTNIAVNAGTFTIGGNTALTLGNNSTLSVGGTGSLGMAGRLSLGSSDTISITGGTTSLLAGTSAVLGNNDTLTVSGGTFNSGYESWGSGDIISVSGGTASIGGNYVLTGTNATINVSGGKLTITGLTGVSNSYISVSGGTLALGPYSAGTASTVNLGSSSASSQSATLSITSTGYFANPITIESGQTGSGIIYLENASTGTVHVGYGIGGAPVPVLINNNVTVVNTGTTGSLLFDFYEDVAAGSSTTSTITFDSSGYSNSVLSFENNGGASSHAFLGNYSLRGGGMISLSGARTFQIGSSLSGAGGITQNLTMAAGSVLNPGGYNGSSAGVLTVMNTLSISSGSNLVFSLNGVGSSSDMVAVGTGGSLLSFAGTTGQLVNLSLNNVTLPPLNSSATYEIFSYGTYAGDTSTDITDDFAITLNGSSSGVYSSFANVDVTDPSGGASNGQIDVVVSSVPEPASLSLLGLSAVGLLSRRRKRRKANSI